MNKKDFYYLSKALSPILTRVSIKYTENGKHSSRVSLMSDNTIMIEVSKYHDPLNGTFSIQTLGEFYHKHINWIKEIPQQHAIFMAYVLGSRQNV